MGLFRRAARADETAVDDQLDGPQDDAAQGSTADEAGPDLAAAGDARGPWDVADQPERGSRVDLGAIWLPGVNGMELRMELDDSRKVVTAAAVTIDGSTLQIQAFAAPRTAGIWDDIRGEIAESVTKQGGSADDLPGPFGRELLARLPVRTSDGRTSHRPARFIGADGPRWFVRGVLTGHAATDPESARVLEGLFADVVVVRGGDARAPRELLPLTLPGAAKPAEGDAGPGAKPSLQDPFKRGPEITEVH